MKGIYQLEINGKLYIGKDHSISNDRRYKQHINLLKKGEHYNKYLQRSYNKYGYVNYKRIYWSSMINLKTLSELEVVMISNRKSYESGFNLTVGGEGHKGYKVSAENIKKMLERGTNANPMSKISKDDFFEIVDLLIDGLTNIEIGRRYNLHPNYISLIRHKKRHQVWWKEAREYKPLKSSGNKVHSRMNDKIFLDIVKRIDAGESNASIEKVYGYSGGMVSRIRHQKIHLEYWTKHFPTRLKGATTISKESTP